MTEPYAPVPLIAADCGVSRQTVYAWVHRYGLRTRASLHGPLLVHVADALRCEAATRPERERRRSRRIA